MRLWLGFLVILAPLTGCATANHRATDLAATSDATDAGLPLAARNRVHVYILDGYEPYVGTNLGRLRDRLNEAGFAKVSAGGMLFAGKFETAIRRQHANDPETRFLFVGRGRGAEAADALARKLEAEGIAVETVIALAPRVRPESTAMMTVRRIELEDAETGVEDLVNSLAAEAAGVIAPAPSLRTAVVPMIDHAAPLPMSRPALAAIPATRKPVQGVLTGTQFR